MPCIQRSVKETFTDVPLIKSANVDEVVALGAVLYAAIRCDSSQNNAVQNAALAPFNLQEVTNMNFGTVVISYNEDTGMPYKSNSVLIKKGTPIPCSKQESFYTRYDGQKEVRCTITECALEETDLNEFIRMISDDTMLKLPDLPEGAIWLADEEIVVTFSYDENQIMHCSFEHKSSGHSEEVVLDFNQASDDSEESADS